ncbi:hypothetical protein [Promicromonospora sp. NPDC023805]|uniref:hypothetical protein n=1 Tax=Promicromonospora sp. NPDC023805 TaxID=3154696 RepID=UPI0033D74357
MSLTHRPPRDQPPADRMHKHFVERLTRNGAPLVTRPLQELLPRQRRRIPLRLWQVAEVARKATLEVLTGTVLGVATAAIVVGPVARGMGWI